jgi:threonine aldolase
MSDQNNSQNYMHFFKSFASDNYSGVSPEVMDFLQSINRDHIAPYGNDDISKHARDLIRRAFQTDADVYFAMTGTAANVMSVNIATRNFECVICPDNSHLNQHEGGAPEALTNRKLVSVPGENGRLSVSELEKKLNWLKMFAPHTPRPKLVTIAQSTELGTVYTVDELKQLADYAHQNGLYLHIDGCRIYNAAVALGVELADISTHIGVDIMSIGGTKNGLMMAEAVLVFNHNLRDDYRHLQKQDLQMYSKMRYLAAQYIPFFENDLWKRNAKQANGMTSLLVSELSTIEGVKVEIKPETNHLFVILPKEVIAPLQEEFHFYTWEAEKNLVRLVTSFDTTEQEVRAFVSRIKELIYKNQN